MPLVLDHVSKSFPLKTGMLSVIEDCSFRLEEGESLAITGTSGSGKSTLLSMIGTLQPPSSGTITIDGLNPFGLDDQKLAAFRREKIGFVFQDHHLLPQCGALENVLIPALGAGLINPEHISRGKKLLDSVGLGERLEHRPGELSGGERQRVAIARALFYAPKLLLADEPTGNLDPKNAAGIVELLLEMRKEHSGMLILVTHDMKIAEKMGRNIILGSR